MAKTIQRTGFLFGTVVILLCFYCDCKPLDGYAFPVYTTEVCPRNLTEWRERSSAINCTKRNAYMCVPNENITELLEFCYSLPQILIVKGLCMFLYKHHSILDAYECSHFTEGCPSSNYRSQDVNVYQSCVAITNGCFLADPICNRAKTMYPLDNSTSTTVYIKTTEITQHEETDWVFISKLIMSGVGGIAFLAICTTCFILLSKSPESTVPIGNEQEFLLSELLEADAEEGNQSNEESDLSLIGRKTNDNEDKKNPQEMVVFSALKSACEKGQDTIIKCLIKRGAKINALDKDGYGPLSIACSKGYENTVQLLIDNGADINLYQKNGVSPLYIACKNGNDSIVQLLMKNGADINLYNDTGATPLYVACENGHDSAVQLLLNHCADINLCTNFGSSPLYIACQNGHESTVHLLLNNGAHINLCEKTGSSPLFIACQNGHDSIVQLLLRNGADINLSKNNGVSPLCVACEYGHESTVQLLLKNGADIKTESVLYVVSQEGHDNI